MNIMVYYAALLEFSQIVWRCELVEYKDAPFELMDKIKVATDLEKLHLCEKEISLLRSALLYVENEFYGYEATIQTRTGYEMEQFIAALKCLPKSRIVWDDED